MWVAVRTDGPAIAYVDFSQLNSQAIKVSANRTAVTVKLPKAHLEPAVLNVAQSYVYAEQRGLFNRIGNFFSGNPNSQQQVYILAQQKIRAAPSPGPRTRPTLGTRAFPRTREFL